MFARFTGQARQVVVLAQEEARLLGHDYIGTEHLLLGLLRAEDGMAEVLSGFSVTLEQVRARIREMVGPGEGAKGGQIPFTPRAKKVLELSLQAAMSMGHAFIAPGHIMLGLLGEGEGVAARVLAELDVDERRLREQVVAASESEAAGASPPRPAEAGAVASIVRQKGAWPAQLWSTLNQLGFEIRRDLARPPDSGDLLALLPGLPDGIARQALNDLRVEDAAMGDAIAGARERSREAKLERDPELRQALEIVQGRRERAARDGDSSLAAELGEVERGLVEAAAGGKGVKWGTVLPRLRERLGLRGEDPPGQRPAASGG